MGAQQLCVLLHDGAVSCTGSHVQVCIARVLPSTSVRKTYRVSRRVPPESFGDDGIDYTLLYVYLNEGKTRLHCVDKY